MKKLILSLLILISLKSFINAQGVKIRALPLSPTAGDSALFPGSLNGVTYSFFGVDLSKNRIATLVPQTRTITINGVTLDLSTNRSWSVSAFNPSYTIKQWLNGYGSFVNANSDSLAEGGVNQFFTQTRVRTTPLTGFISGAGTVSATDNILQAIQKLNGNDALKVLNTVTVNGKALSTNITLNLASSDFSNQGTATTVLHGNASGNPSFSAVSLSSDVSGNLPIASIDPSGLTQQTDTSFKILVTNGTTIRKAWWLGGAGGSSLTYPYSTLTYLNGYGNFPALNTDSIGVEGSTNKWFTNARVLTAPLTGFTSGAGTLSSSDNILQAIQKLDGNIAGKQATLVSGTSIKTINSGSLLGSGDIPLPTLSADNTYTGQGIFNKSITLSAGTAISAAVYSTITNTSGAAMAAFRVAPFVVSTGSGNNNILEVGTMNAANGGGTFSGKLVVDQFGNTTIAGFIGAGGAVTGGIFKGSGLIMADNATAKTTTYTITTSDFHVRGDATSAAFTITLPTAVGATGQIYIIRKIDASANAVTVGTTSSQNINTTTSATTYSLPTQGKFIIVQSNNVSWDQIGGN